jgi:CBS domain-containing protein
MRERHVGYLVVTESIQSGARERPVGVLTDRDIVVSVVARKLNSERVTVGEVMTQPPVTVCETDPVEKALREMRRVGVRRLPLVDQQGMLLGIVSHDAVLAFIGRGLRSIMDSIGEYPDK